MFEAVGSELVVAAVIGLFSFIGSMLAVKVELRFINKEVERIGEESRGNGNAVQVNAIEIERIKSRLHVLEEIG